MTGLEALQSLRSTGKIRGMVVFVPVFTLGFLTVGKVEDDKGRIQV